MRICFAHIYQYVNCVFAVHDNALRTHATSGEEDDEQAHEALVVLHSLRFMTPNFAAH